ncbi:Uncharacterised protein [uncultured archaeon]|nr:Uncharacterised protein [uncultured archaeon]
MAKASAILVGVLLIGVLMFGCTGKYPSLGNITNISQNQTYMTNASNASQAYQNASNATSDANASIMTAPVNVSANVSAEPANVSKPPVAARTLQLEGYDGGFFTIRKPVGWEVSHAGSCATFAFVIRNATNPGEQVFYYGEVGPVYLAESQKALDKNYMDMGGYPVLWYEMPVVDPLTPENFLQRFHLIADTDISKTFMAQTPRLDGIEIVSSVSSQSPLSGETKTMRALFMQDGTPKEGMFYVTVAPLIPLTGYASGGIGYAFSFMGISADKDEFRDMEAKLTESVGSLTLSQDYVSNCLQQQDKTAQAVLNAGKTLSDTSDILMDTWEGRNKVDDILSEKRSDTMLSRDRVYDPDTGEVYDVQNGFYDDYNINRDRYDMSNLQQLPADSWDLWTAPTQPATEIR